MPPESRLGYRISLYRDGGVAVREATTPIEPAVYRFGDWLVEQAPSVAIERGMFVRLNSRGT
jgi:hypothetical protein